MKEFDHDDLYRLIKISKIYIVVLEKMETYAVINHIAAKSPHIKKHQILTSAIIKIIIIGTKNFVFHKFKHKYV
jgi:hypothetical protein